MRLRQVLVLGLVLAVAAVIQAQNTTTQPRPAQTTNLYPTPLYQMNDVSKTLNLNEKQITQLNDLNTRIQTKYSKDYEKLSTLPEKDRFTQTQDLNRRYMTDWSAGAKDVFNADQMTRYQQLQYQYGGFNSLYDPAVQKRLNLTEEQVRNLNDSATWSAQQMADINRMGATDREKATQAYRDYQKAYSERWNRYLTPEQQRTWREIAGEPYTFQPYFPTTPRQP